ncbi:Gfo/Idh/MocA family oxidoreductase [Gammaproteobacteria bacterium]|nr:Gfo/Idh/MocA family oxidoreductase [Gammaproteobacteria bacterium]
MINIGLIGYGYWGPNLARNIMAHPDTQLLVVCDRDPLRTEGLRSMHPSVQITTRPEDIINNRAVAAIVVATPLASHYELAMAALSAGKHVLVEKPIAATSEQAAEMAEEAACRNLTLLVDHTFVYTGAVRKMRDITRESSFGQIQYYDSTRVNLGIFQRDINVVWDLAVHDLSIMTYLLEDDPVAVSATGHSHIQGQHENMASLTLFFDTNLIAQVNVNWLSPVKIRRTLIGGSKQMIVYDDLETSEKLKIYNKSVKVTETPDEIHKLLISYRTGDLWSPNVDSTEALQREIEHFLSCISGEQSPLTSAEDGVKIIRILEATD